VQGGEEPAVDRAADPVLTTKHLRRLRGYWRSAGWPCHDALDVDLLAAGLLERCTPDANGLEALRVTDAGVGALERDFARTRSALDRHDALVERVARALVEEGRIVFRGLALRAPSERRWQPVKPDVFSIRNSPREALLAPLVHEIKVSRTDLLADLRRAGKRGAYQAISQQCYYVIAEGIAEPAEIPEDCGVVIARATRLERVRLSPVRDVRLATLHWIALAKGRAEYGADPAGAQLGLGDEAAGETA
jgi:hypothetical protein